MLIANSAKTVLSVKHRGVGVVIAGRYRLERTIGAGGMGTVWLAHDLSLDAKCAIKLIDEDSSANAEIRLRFEREAKASARLRSAHVVDVIDFGEWDGMCFIAMEYLEGEDLSSRLQRVGKLDSETTYRIVAHVARALMHAHAQGIVHRDLKPENIFLVRGYDEEIAKVLDFGIARSETHVLDDQVTHEGAFLGTPCYVSPEQARGKPVDYRSDLWSLGVIAFECLTGHLPFNSDSLGDLMGLILYEPIPRPTSFNPALPPPIDAWWERAAARDRERRFASAKEMADELGEALGVAAIVGVPTGRSKDRRSYPSINDQSGVIFAPAPTAQCSTPKLQKDPPPLALPSPAAPRTFRVPVVLSALALLLSIGAIFGVWFRGRAAEASAASHASSVTRSRVQEPRPVTTPAPRAAAALTEQKPLAVSDLPPAGSTIGPEVKPPNAANASGPEKHSPVPRRTPHPKPRSVPDYGI